MNTKGNIFTDIRAAVKLTGEIRKARKAGANAVQIKPVHTVPVLNLDYWVWTPEGCLFYGQKWKPFVDAFEALPKDMQHKLTFLPERWTDRVLFWKEHLRPYLPPKQYHEALAILANRGARCQRRRLAALEGVMV